MNAADHRRLLEMATQYEEQGNDLLAKARGIRITLDLLNATAVVEAITQLPQKLAKAVKMHAAKPTTKQRGTVIQAVRATLSTGPMSLPDLQAALLSRYGLRVPGKRFLDMAAKKKLVTKGFRENRTYALPGTALSGKPTDNGHGQLYPFVMPTLPVDAPKRLKAQAVSYAVCQMVKQADGPVATTDIIASAKAAGVKIRGQAIGALARYGAIKRSSGAHSRHTTFVLGSHVPPLFAEIDALNAK